MRRCRRSSIALVCVLPLVLSGPVTAQADTFTSVFKAYSRTGTISPCTFTAAQLKQAKGQIPADYAQYAPDFKDAIDAALKARAAGACKASQGGGSPTATAPAGPAGTGTTPGGTPAPSGATTAPATTAPASPSATTSTPQPAPSVDPAPVVADNAIPAAAAGTTESDGDGTSPALVVLAIVALLALAAALVAWAFRWWAADPPWLQRSRHATAEAGWRTSAAWAEFTDWLRLGR